MLEIKISHEEFARESLQNFSRQYPDEKACLRTFQPICKACCRINETDERRFTCSKCKTITSRTSGTYFHRLKTLRPTFALIWLYEDRAVLSINKFAEIFDMKYGPAWEAEARIKAVLEKEMNTHDVFEVASSVFNPVICKRSTQSLAGKHPRHEDDTKIPELENFATMDADLLAVYATLRSQPIDQETLFNSSGLSIAKFNSSIAMLNLMGIADRHFGNKFSLCISNPVTAVSEHEKETVQEFIAYARNFHGVSKKYLQRELASFWAHLAHARWSGGTLLASCMKYEHLNRAQLMSPETRTMVRVACLK